MKNKEKLIIALGIILIIPNSIYAAKVYDTSKIGKYIAEADGRNGIVKLEIEIEENNGLKKLKSITPVEHKETGWAWDMVYPALTEKIIENNGTDGVDIISHATISSEAIIKATDVAITKSKETEDPVIEHRLVNKITNDSKIGTYKSSNKGYVDPICIELIVDEIDGNKYIKDLIVTQNESRWKRVEDADFVRKIIENNGTDGIDDVSGATVTSRAIKSATNRAIKESKGIVADNTTIVDTNIKSPDEIFNGAEGTRLSPYLIENEDVLIDFAKSVNKYTYEGKYIKLNEDILLTREWVPAGSFKAPFEGEFDGNNKKISNIYVGNYENPKVVNDVAGLFSSFGDNAYIHDLKLDFEAYVTSNKNFRVGALVGYNYGAKIENIDAFSNIFAKSDEAKNIYVGGIVGEIRNGKLLNSTSEVSLRGEVRGGLSQVGGLVGMSNRGLIANSLANGKISATADRVMEGMPVMGGIVATNGGTTVNNYSNVMISSDVYSKYLGTITGWATGISDNYQNYTREKRKITVDSKNENKREFSIPYGFVVGASINEYGEKNTGSVIIDARTFNDDEIKNGDLTKTLNDNINNSKIDIEKGGRLKGHFSPDKSIEFRLWDNDKATMYLTEKKSKPIYDTNTESEILNLIPKEVDPLNEGEFFGRSKDKSTIVKIEVDKYGKIIKIDADEIYKNEIDEILNGKDIEKVADKNLKEALKEAIKKSKKLDLSNYNKSDLSIYSGEGTIDNPYKIISEGDLRNLALIVNSEADLRDKYFSIENDIDLTENFTPIGGGGKYPFAGHILGNNHKIKNMRIGSKDMPYKGEYVGLFSEITGSIKDLNLENYEIYVEHNSNSKSFVGAVAAHLNGRKSSPVVDNVTANGKIYIKTDSGLIYSGGLFAQSDNAIIQNSKSDVDLYAESKSSDLYAAAIMGLNNRSAVYNNIATGTIKAKSSLNRTHLGGVAGYNAGTLFNNYSSVDIISESQTGDVGFVAGRNTGIGFMYNNYYEDDKAIVVEGIEKEATHVGVVADSTTDIKNELKENKGIKASQYKEILNQNISNLDLINTPNSRVSYLDLSKISLKYHDIKKSPDNTDNKNIIDDSNDKKDTKDIKDDINDIDDRKDNINTKDTKTIETKDIENKNKNYYYDDNSYSNTYNYVPFYPGFNNIEKNEIRIKDKKLSKFLDIDNHWAKDAINWAFLNNIAKGITEDEFKPDKTISRAEFITLLYRISKDSVSDKTPRFNDLDSNAYYIDAINWAFDKKIALGYEDGSFGPNDDITREEMATIIKRFIEYKNYNFKKETINTYKDSDDISDWSKDAVTILSKYKILNGDGEKFNPKSKATRAEVVQMLYNMDNLEYVKKSIL